MYNAMMDDEMWKTLRGQYWEKGTWPNSWRCLVQGWVALDDLCGFLPAQHVLWSPQYKMLIKLSISASRLSSVMGISMQGYRWLFIKIQEFSLQPELKCLHVFSGEIHFWRKNPLRLNFSYLLITHWEGFLPHFIFTYPLQWPSITIKKAMKCPQVKKRVFFSSSKKSAVWIIIVLYLDSAELQKWCVSDTSEN